MNFDDVRKKVRSFNWKAFFTSRNFIIICCVFVLGGAIVVYNVAAGGHAAAETPSGSKQLGNTVLVGSEVSGDAAETGTDDGDSFFAVSIINRERTRGEAMDVLRTIADSPDAMPGAKEEALTSIAAMVDEMNAEANIEMLVKSKGFADCVAVISGAKCTVIVKAEELLQDEVAQILEIAVEQAGLSAPDVKIKVKK